MDIKILTLSFFIFNNLSFSQALIISSKLTASFDVNCSFDCALNAKYRTTLKKKSKGYIELIRNISEIKSKKVISIYENNVSYYGLIFINDTNCIEKLGYSNSYIIYENKYYEMSKSFRKFIWDFIDKKEYGDTLFIRDFYFK